MRRRLVVVLAVVLSLSIAGVLARTLSGTTSRHAQGTGTADQDVLAEVSATVSPGLAFRTTSIGRRNGAVAEVTLGRAGSRVTTGDRRVLGPTCDRVYATLRAMVCLRTDAGVTTTFEAVVLDDRRHVLSRWQLPGPPSRARVSPSGRLVATTVFVSGVSYGQAHFQTATEIRTVDGVSQGNLDSYALFVQGRRVSTPARNLWGVTFHDDDTFYATAEVHGATWLVKGDLPSRTLTSVRRNAECPSVSPDGRLVAYKKRTPERSTHWSLAVLDLSTGRERLLGERRSVDDQVEWLGRRQLLYGLLRAGHPGVTDVWTVGTGRGAPAPRRLLADAWSPTVVS